MSETLSLMCTLAVRGAFERVLLPAFEREGYRTEVLWSPTKVIMDRIAAGERADAVFVVSESMDALAAQGVIDPGSRIEVARSGLGVAVKAGAPHPDLSSAEAFRQTLLGARCVAYSRAGASGIYFSQLIERLGIAAEINARAVVIPAGFTAEKLLTGEADLAIQQMSELMAVPGIEIAGRFPDAVQTFITISAAVFRGAPNGALAAQLLQTLRTEAAFSAYRESGLDAVA